MFLQNIWELLDTAKLCMQSLLYQYFESFNFVSPMLRDNFPHIWFPKGSGTSKVAGPVFRGPRRDWSTLLDTEAALANANSTSEADTIL